MSRKHKKSYDTYCKQHAKRVSKHGLHISFTPPKQAIYEVFDEQISKSAIKRWDDQWCIIGNTCIINLEPGGVFDVWIGHPGEILSSIGQKAVRSRLRVFESPYTSLISELDGEGVVKTKDKELILRNLKLLGIRKARTISKETREKLLKNLLAKKKKKKNDPED